MSSFLVIDDDRESSAVIAGLLLEKNLEVRVARTDEEALAALDERPADVMIAALRLGEPSERARLEKLRAAAPSVATIALASEITPVDRILAEELGVSSVLLRGAPPAELEEAVRRARELTGGFRGSLHGLNLHDVLQMFHLNKRSLSVHVGGRAAGRVDFDRGEIVHALRGERVGRAALAAILGSSSGSVRTTPRTDTARTITQDFAALMLETMHQMDEGGRGQTVPPVPSPDDESLDDRIDRLDALDLQSMLPGLAIGSSPEDGSGGFGDRTMTDGTSAASRGSSGGASSGIGPAPAVGVSSPSSIARARDALCRAVVAEVPGAVAVALFAVASGELVGVELDVPMDRGFERDWVAYFRAIFAGPELQVLSARLDDGPYVEEAHLTTRHGHLLGRAVKGGSHVLLLMLPKSRDVPAAWAAVRALLRGVESNI